MAPNPAMVELLRRETGHPPYPMEHGVDLNRFSPAPEPRRAGPFRIG
jgi:hypothetical protein